MLRFLPLVSVALLHPVATFACPTVDDLKTGVLLILSDGQQEVHKSVGQNMVQVDVRYNDGTADGSVMQFAHGLYLRNVIPVEAGVVKLGQQEKYSSDSTLRSWPEPVPSASWENSRSDGGSAKSSQTRTMRIGGCSYESFDVTLRFNDDPNYGETYAYLPTLGIGLLTESVEGNDRESYKYVSIAKAP